VILIDSPVLRFNHGDSHPRSSFMPTGMGYTVSALYGKEERMKRLLIPVLTGLLISSGLLVAHAFEQTRTYSRSIEAVWDEVVKATRDVDFVLVDSDRSKHELSMRTKSKMSAKRGLYMNLKLDETIDGTRVKVWPEDPAKVKKTAKHITKYLQALDKRIE
jgi:hypothetical protein